MPISVFHSLPQDSWTKLVDHSHNFLLPVDSLEVWSPPAPRRQSHSTHSLHWLTFPFLLLTLPHPVLGVHLRKSKSFLNSDSAPGNPKLSCMQHHPTGGLEPLFRGMMKSSIQGCKMSHLPTFSIFTCPLTFEAQVGCADAKKQARKRITLELVPSNIHTRVKCPDVWVMRSKPWHPASIG